MASIALDTVRLVFSEVMSDSRMAGITEVYVFGSLLYGQSDVGDVDVLLVRRDEDVSNHALVSAQTRLLDDVFFARTSVSLDQVRLSRSELAQTKFLESVTYLKIWPEHLREEANTSINPQQDVR